MKYAALSLLCPPRLYAGAWVYTPALLCCQFRAVKYDRHSLSSACRDWASAPCFRLSTFNQRLWRSIILISFCHICIGSSVLNSVSTNAYRSELHSFALLALRKIFTMYILLFRGLSFHLCPRSCTSMCYLVRPRLPCLFLWQFCIWSSFLLLPLSLI